ncbi:hypothetical protein P691DRAFT_781236 [Macrolepiota fuliginosa MF-IS2]|uniref:Uncharacterized protein n=1 Tax=Macrolepiota fuliginosa MF-IS2 TaxID=1400762 RepID=A0A9P5WXD6_9AGAR|nr:hypothetical protein P691DRAFT_781236 [Macrolepiota fuliginosa MF-IS2]
MVDRVHSCAQCHQDGKGCFLLSGPSWPISGHKVNQVDKAPTKLLQETRDTNNLLQEIGDQLGVLIEVSRENTNASQRCLARLRMHEYLLNVAHRGDDDGPNDPQNK